MANALYTKGRQAFLDGGVSWSSDTIKVSLVSSGYTPNLSTHQYVSDVTGAGGTLVATQTLGSKTSTGGTANAANVTFPSVTGAVCNYLLLYKDTGSPSTSPLIALIDSAVNLPVTPVGSNINISWDTGTYKIFEL